MAILQKLVSHGGKRLSLYADKGCHLRKMAALLFPEESSTILRLQLEALIYRFRPLIRKCGRQLHIEDGEQEMVVAFIELIKRFRPERLRVSVKYNMR